MMSPSSARWPGWILSILQSMAGLHAATPMPQNDAGFYAPTILPAFQATASKIITSSMFVHLIVIGWLYVVVMMSVAEATNTNGTVLGAIVTFLLYGLLPIMLVVYLLGAPGRRKALRARELAEQEAARKAALAASQAAPAGSGLPDAGGETPADAVAPVRKET
jgi:hypothetical protein